MNPFVRTEVFIEPKVSGKGRTFRATYLCSVTANTLWSGGTTGKDGVDRPVYASFCGSDAELRPFVANLMLGRSALFPSQGRRSGQNGFEFLKSVGYKFLWQREPEGSVVSVFLPELFLLDPGMVDPKEAKFVFLPSAEWCARQELPSVDVVKYARELPFVRALNTPPAPRYKGEEVRFTPPLPDELLTSLVPVAYLFAACLDRRTRAPIVADGRFYLQLMLRCLKDGLATWTRERGAYESFGRHHAGFTERGTEEIGFLPGVMFRSDHDTLEALLAEEIAAFFELTQKRGRK